MENAHISIEPSLGRMKGDRKGQDWGRSPCCRMEPVERTAEEMGRKERNGTRQEQEGTWLRALRGQS